MCVCFFSVKPAFLGKGIRNSWLVGDGLLARSILWAFRGELSWFPHVRGFSGLVRRLEGALGARHDVLEDAQLDSFVAGKESTLLWASVLDTSVALDNHPSVPAKHNLDLARIWRQSSSSGAASDEQLFLQFALTVEEEGLGSEGWSTRGRVKVDLLGPETRLSLVLDEADRLLLRLPSPADDDSASLVVARLSPSVAGVPRLVSVTFGANWSCLVQVDQATPFTAVIPERLRDDVGFEQLAAVELRASSRAALRYLLVTADAALASDVRYFTARRIAALHEGVSGGGGGSSFREGSEGALSWKALLLAVATLAGGPLLVARLAAFDTGLIPKKVFVLVFLFLSC